MTLNSLPIDLPSLSSPANIQTALTDVYYGAAGSDATEAELLAQANGIAAHLQRLVTNKANVVSPSFTTPSLGVATAVTINGTTIPLNKTLVTTDAGSITTAMISPSSTNGQILRTLSGSAQWVDPTTVPSASLINSVSFTDGTSTVSFNGTAPLTVSRSTLSAAAATHNHVWTDITDRPVAATPSVLGLVRVDDSSVKVSSGILSVGTSLASTTSVNGTTIPSSKELVTTVSTTKIAAGTSGTADTAIKGARSSSTGYQQIFVSAADPTTYGGGVTVSDGDIWMW